MSSDDIPQSKYKKVAVFVEHPSADHIPIAIQAVIGALRGVGVNAADGADVLAQQGRLDEKRKAAFIQKHFDAVLYVSVVQNGIAAERIPNAHHDGQTITLEKITQGELISFRGSLSFEIDEDTPSRYILNTDGSVDELRSVLKIKSDLQDTKSAKQVWTAETITSGRTPVSLEQLYGQASNQIADKLRSDNAI